MKGIDALRDMLCDELEQFSKKGELYSGDLDTLHVVTDTIKNLYKIEMYESGGYSRSDGGYSRNEGNYSRGDNGHSRDDGRYSYRGNSGRHYVRGHYSRDGGGMLERLEEMMNDAGNDQEREEIKRCIDRMRDKS